MENQQWTAEYQQQSVVMSVERTDESSNNGICDNLLEDAGKGSDQCSTNGICDSNSRMQVIEAAISEKARLTIQNILEQVKALSKIEKLLLYLKLPTEHSNSIDPLRQPLNPLGSRAEIHRTISWIKTHLEEDPEISLPKQDVYDEYSNYCHENKMKPLSQADFGKVMKQVYPKVRARRLGTRGNSRYCYSGLQRRHKLDTPSLPDLSDKPMSTEPYYTQSDLMGAAWLIVKEWSEQQLGAQFPSLHALACYLVLNLSVSAGTAAAALVTTIAENQLKDDQSSATYGSSKHREMQLQLQKKLQQKNDVNRDHKRKMQQQSPKTEPKSRCKRSKTQLPQTVNQPTSSSTSPVVALEHAKTETNTSPTQGTHSVCDKSLDYNLQALPDFSSFQKPATCEGKGSENEGKVAIPRIAGKVASPKTEKGVYECVTQDKVEKSVKYKNILPKPELCDIVTYNPQLTLSVQTAETRSHQDTVNCKKQKRKKTSPENPVPMLVNQEEHFTRERLASVGSVDKDAMDEYLGTNNSQEHEEELLKYFKNNNLDEHDQENSSKLSQLRQLLEQNGIAEREKIEIGTSKRSIIKPDIKGSSQVACNRQSSLPSNMYNSTTRRRVSFETPLPEEAVPASPNTRRKNFSFTPISPGPLSPNGRQSKCSSTNASPFVSPRNTPVPRVRSSVHQNSGLTYSNSQLNSAPTSLVNIASVRNKINGNKTATRVKQELELKLEIGGEGKQQPYPKNFVTMSAPPSPMLPSKTNTNLLQTLLNSQNKVPYTPDYTQGQIQPHITGDPLSTEITQLFSNAQHNAEISYRSQSAPLHPNLLTPINQNAYFSHFTFNLGESEPTTHVNEFTELENLTETDEDINVNKIIHGLEDPINENALQSNENGVLTDSIVMEQNVFDNIEMSLSSLPAEQGFTEENVNFNSHFKSSGRSQSVDVDLSSTSLKFNPSRSVPSTPLPIPKGNLISDSVGQSSRSYPSTPLLASETFSYNQDYLLNAQMVKEESVGSLDMQGQLETLIMLPNAEELYNSVMDDVLVECNKQNFSFGEGNVESKCPSEQNFDGGPSGS